jgi:hypothetical protein
MTDASEIARSELVDADLPLKRTGDLELASHTAEPNDAARYITPTAGHDPGHDPVGIWLPTVDENHRDKIIVQDVQPARWDARSLLVLINGVVGAIAGAYVATRSVPVTALAGGAALLLAVLVVWRK